MVVIEPIKRISKTQVIPSMESLKIGILKGNGISKSNGDKPPISPDRFKRLRLMGASL